MSGGQVHVVVIRIGCGIDGNYIRTVGNQPYAHVPGLIVLSAGTHEDAQICCMPLFSTDPVILFEYTFIEYGKRNS
jgi:pyruvate dehydrogenase E1 component beta subunit